MSQKRAKKIKRMVNKCSVDSLQKINIVGYQDIGYINNIFGLGYGVNYIPIWQLPKTEKQIKKYLARRLRKNKK